MFKLELNAKDISILVATLRSKAIQLTRAGALHEANEVRALIEKLEEQTGWGKLNV